MLPLHGSSLLPAGGCPYFSGRATTSFLMPVCLLPPHPLLWSRPHQLCPNPCSHLTAPPLLSNFLLHIRSLHLSAASWIFHRCKSHLGTYGSLLLPWKEVNLYITVLKAGQPCWDLTATIRPPSAPHSPATLTSLLLKQVKFISASVGAVPLAWLVLLFKIFIFIWMWTIFKVFIEFVAVLLLLYVLLFHRKARGILAPRPRIELAPFSALEGKVLTTGPPQMFRLACS